MATEQEIDTLLKSLKKYESNAKEIRKHLRSQGHIFWSRIALPDETKKSLWVLKGSTKQTLHSIINEMISVSKDYMMFLNKSLKGSDEELRDFLHIRFKAQVDREIAEEFPENKGE